MKRILTICTIFIALLLANTTFAIDLDKYPGLKPIITTLVKEHDFTETELLDVFGKVEYRDDIIEAINRPGEAQPWHKYRLLFVTEQSVNRGIRFWRQNARALVKAQKKYGVPAEIIVAIIGVETRYGRLKGRYKVINALTTLALGYPRRGEFFRKELIEFLLLARETNTDPLKYQGSYAGAMGLPQFMPSSYRKYAVDFNGDNKRDLINNRWDAIGSVANFFIKHGWQTNEPICEDVQIEGQLYVWFEKLGIKPRLSIRHLINAGIFPENDKRREDRLVSLIALEGENGPVYRLGYNNFYVITKYNRSRKYAMAVYELSEMLRKKYYNKRP
ncbi:MAG: lytic murein transglycosylase B [Gammaproteobacteria bacterium]|nr:MAG: lytic murein transglycosylase B [Gammaproteobacteria bacterium]